MRSMEFILNLNTIGIGLTKSISMVCFTPRGIDSITVDDDRAILRTALAFKPREVSTALVVDSVLARVKAVSAQK